MTVSEQINKVTLECDGIETEFDFTIKYRLNEDIKVYVVDIDDIATEDDLVTEGSDYTLTSPDKALGGTVTFGTAPLDTKQVFIIRRMALTQPVPFKPNTNFPEGVIEAALDKLTMITQELNEVDGRCVKTAMNSDVTGLVLPTPDTGKTLKWNATEDGFENSDNDPDEVVSLAESFATASASSATASSNSATAASNSATASSNSATASASSATASDLSAGRAEAAASALEGVVPASGDENKFLMCNDPFTNGVSYQEVQGGVVKFNNLGSISSNQTLNKNEITIAAFTGTPTVSLPVVTDTTKQVECDLNFTTASTGYPIVNQYKALTGTFAVTNGSTTVTGTGSALTTEIKANDKILIAGVEYTVSSVTSNTVLVLTAVYAGTTARGLTLSRRIVRWSAKGGGKAPSAYSILAGVRNKLTFKSVWESGLLYWETEYDTYGGVETVFVRPNLGANGTMGGASFAVRSTSVYVGAIYLAFDGNSGTDSEFTVGSQNIDMYNPIPIKVSSFVGDWYDSSYSANSGSIYGSNDDNIWTLLHTFTGAAADPQTLVIPEANRGFYKYYRINVASSTQGTYAQLREMVINAVYTAI